MRLCLWLTVAMLGLFFGGRDGQADRIPKCAGEVALTRTGLVGPGDQQCNLAGLIIKPVDKPYVTEQWRHFGPKELAAARDGWGATAIRVLTSQAALDPQWPLSEKVPGYIERIRDAVHTLIANGFILIVGLNWQEGTGASQAYSARHCMVTDSTLRAWRVLHDRVPELFDPAFKNQVMLELFNEPVASGGHDEASFQLWQNGGHMPAAGKCKTAYVIGVNQAIAELRDLGAQNTIIVDGLGYAHFLNRAYPPTDPRRKVACAVHPFAEGWEDFHLDGNRTHDEAVFDKAFFDAAKSCPILVTALGGGGTKDCHSKTPDIDDITLEYSWSHRMGVIGYTFDEPMDSLTIDWDYNPSTYRGYQCPPGVTPGQGMGEHLQRLLRKAPML